MKKIISVLLIIAMCMTVLCSCGEKLPDSAEKALEIELDKVKNPDPKQLEELVNSSAEGDASILKMFDDFDMTLLYKNFDYEIISCTEDGDKATAKVKMKNLNFGKIMNDYASQMFSYILGIYSDDMSEEEYYDLTYKKSAELLTALITSGDYEKLEKEIDITLSKKDGVWTIDKALPAEGILTGLESFSEMLAGGF